MAKKSKRITYTIETYKDTDGLFELGHELGLSEKRIYEVFEYGEYANFEIIIDENLNIVGGKIIPCGK